MTGRGEGLHLAHHIRRFAWNRSAQVVDLLGSVTMIPVDLEVNISTHPDMGHTTT